MRLDSEERKIQAPISWLIHSILGPSVLTHWNSLWALQKWRVRRGALLSLTGLRHWLFNFLNTVKFSPGSVGHLTQRLSECWVRVRGVDTCPFCHPHTSKPLDALVPEGAVGMCAHLLSQSCPHWKPPGTLTLKHREARQWVVLKASVTVWLDGVHS